MIVGRVHLPSMELLAQLVPPAVAGHNTVMLCNCTRYKWHLSSLQEEPEYVFKYQLSTLFSLAKVVLAALEGGLQRMILQSA